MSFVTVIAYAVLCDACGHRFLGHEGEQLEETTAAIGEIASAYGWACMNGRHTCSDCRNLRGIEPSGVTVKGAGA